MPDQTGSSSEARALWEQLRRGMLQAANAISKARPDDPFSLEIRVVKRLESTRDSP